MNEDNSVKKESIDRKKSTTGSIIIFSLLILVSGYFIINMILEKNKRSSVGQKIEELINLKPVSVVDDFMVEPETPDTITVVSNNNGQRSLMVRGWNSTGNLEGPSVIEIHFDSNKELLTVWTKNTTGSVYTGYEVWEDTYYLTLDDVFTYDDNDKIGIGFNSNLESDKGTKGYTGNLRFFKEREYLNIIIFNSNWENYGNYHLKNTDSLRMMMTELYELTKNLEDFQS